MNLNFLNNFFFKVDIGYQLLAPGPINFFLKPYPSQYLARLMYESNLERIMFFYSSWLCSKNNIWSNFVYHLEDLFNGRSCLVRIGPFHMSE